jgi:hypothetical protein
MALKTKEEAIKQDYKLHTSMNCNVAAEVRALWDLIEAKKK